DRKSVVQGKSVDLRGTSERKKKLPFEKAIKCEEERLAGEREKLLANEHYVSYNHRHYAYLSRGIYVEQLQQWMSYFPKEQFLILKSEDLYRDPVTIVRFFFSSRRRHTRCLSDWSSDVCSSD